MHTPTIAIITHESDNFAEWKYFLKLLVHAWEKRGLKVVIVTNMTNYQPADIAFLHVDLTVVPQSCIEVLRRYPRVVNGRALDMQKRLFSDLLVTEESNWAGPVIVKTEWNCGGWREFRAWLENTLIGRILRRHGGFETYHKFRARQEARRSWRDKRLLPYGQYPVYPSSKDVPRGVWKNANLVVEKFISEKNGDEYHCRHWVFLGPREVTFRSYSKDQVVKLNGRMEQTDDEVPADLRAIRAQLGFDYGKFDYCVVDGKTVLYDVNRTPAAGIAERYLWEVPLLENGIDEFFPMPRMAAVLA